MQNNVVAVRSLDIVTAEIHTIERNARRVFLDSVIQIGTRLEEAKQLVTPGNWLNYLNDELGYKPSTAQNYMRLAREFGSSQISLTGKDPRELFAELSYSQLMPLIGLEEAEREQLAENNDLPSMSSREIAALVKERDELKTKLDSTDALKQEAEKAKEEAGRFKNQAQNYKTSFDLEREKASKLAEASKSSALQVEELKKQLDEITEKASKPRELTEIELAEIKKQVADEQADTLKWAEERIQEANKKLEKVKNPAAHKVNFLFRELQDYFDKLAEALIELKETDEDAAEKMRTAINNSVSGWKL